MLPSLSSVVGGPTDIFGTVREEVKLGIFRLSLVMYMYMAFNPFRVKLLLSLPC